MQKQRGLSLVELMISITLGLILMTGVVQMFLSSKDSFNTQQGISRIQETGRLAIEFMSRDLRAAAHYGCLKPAPGSLRDANLNFGGLHTNFAEGIMGYNTVANLPNGGSPTVNLGMANVAANENILVLRSALDVGLDIAQPNTANDVFAFARGNVVANNCIAGMCVGDAIVVSDCYVSRVIRVTALAVNAGVLTVSHGGGWNLASPDPAQNFSRGEVAALKTVVYFIADGIGGRPSLWQRINADPPVELLDGVERMGITYAIAGGPYQTAAQVTAANQWPTIKSVRVELVVRSLENNVLDAAAPYTFAGQQVVPVLTPDGAPDRFLRQVFSTTIDIRGR